MLQRAFILNSSLPWHGPNAIWKLEVCNRKHLTPQMTFIEGPMGDGRGLGSSVEHGHPREQQGGKECECVFHGRIKSRIE